MGIFKWLMKNGVGSVGTIAKFWTDQYIEYAKDCHDAETRFMLNASLIMSFQHGLTAAGMNPIGSNPIYVANICEGKPGMIIMCIVMENVQHIKALQVDDKVVSQAVEIVKEIYEQRTGKKTILSDEAEMKLIKQLINIRYKRAISQEHLKKSNIDIHKPVDDLYFLCQIYTTEVLTLKSPQYPMGAYMEGIMLLMAACRHFTRRYSYVTVDILKQLFSESYIDINRYSDKPFEKYEWMTFVENRMRFYEEAIINLYYNDSKDEAKRMFYGGIITNLLFENPLSSNATPSKDLLTFSLWYPTINTVLAEIKEFIKIRYYNNYDTDDEYDSYFAAGYTKEDYENRCLSCGSIENYVDLVKVISSDEEDGTYIGYFCSYCAKNDENCIIYPEMYSL